jgi:hypothetical protein
MIEVKKQRVMRGEKYNFQRGGGIKYRFWTKIWTPASNFSCCNSYPGTEQASVNETKTSARIYKFMEMNTSEIASLKVKNSEVPGPRTSSFHRKTSFSIPLL